MGKKTVHGALVLCLLTGSVLSGTGMANATGRSAGRSWEPSGTEISGTADSSEAPLLKEDGHYLDSLKRDEKKFYGIDLDSSSTAWTSAVALPKSAKGKYDDGLELELTASDGTRCSGNRPTRGNDDTAPPIGDAVTRTVSKNHDNGSCDEAGHFLLSVQRTDDDSGAAAWPLELRLRTEPGLKKRAIPAPAHTEIPESPKPQRGAAEKTRGGGSPESAPALAEGVWRDHIAGGETVYYGIPLSFGEGLTFQVEFANVSHGDSFDGAPTHLQLYNPAGALLDGHTSTYRGEQAGEKGAFPKISYANRWESGNVQDFSVAGMYYLAVNLGDMQGADAQKVGLTLRVSKRGSPSQGPQYASPPGSTFTVDDRDRDAAKTGAVPSAADGLGLRKILGFAGLGSGGAVLVALLVWVLAGRRRAAADRAAAAQAPGWPGQGPPGWGGSG